MLKLICLLVIAFVTFASVHTADAQGWRYYGTRSGLDIGPGGGMSIAPGGGMSIAPECRLRPAADCRLHLVEECQSRLVTTATTATTERQPPIWQWRCTR
jgi:hypothetical protein